MRWGARCTAMIGAGLMLAACAPLHGGAGGNHGGAASGLRATSSPESTATPAPGPTAVPPAPTTTPTPAPSTAPTPAPTRAATPAPPPAFTSYPLPLGGASRLVSAPDGNLWSVDPNSDAVLRTTPRGSTTVFHTPSGQHVSAELAVTSDGNLWTAEVGSLVRITPGGAMTEIPVPAAQGRGPYALTAGPAGTLWYVAGYGSTLYHRNASGSTSSIALQGASPAEMTWGPDGALWFIDVVTPVGGTPYDRIGRLDVSTQSVTDFPVGNGFGATSPVFAGDGNLWFAEGGAVVRMTTAGAVSRFRLPGSLQLIQLRVGPDGALWGSTGAYSSSPCLARIGFGGAVTVVPVTGLAGGEPITTGVVTGSDGHLWIVVTHGIQAPTGQSDDLVRDNQV